MVVNISSTVRVKAAFTRAILRVGGRLHLTADTQKAVGWRWLVINYPVDYNHTLHWDRLCDDCYNSLVIATSALLLHIVVMLIIRDVLQHCYKGSSYTPLPTRIEQDHHY